MRKAWRGLSRGNERLRSMTGRWQKRPSRITALERQAMFDAQAPEDYKKRALLDGVDVVAGAMERKWGIDRLRTLVADHLRAAFDQQKDLLDAAIRSGDPHLIDIQANGMKRAWQALDAAATQAGAPILSAEVWEFRLPSLHTSLKARHQPICLEENGHRRKRNDMKSCGCAGLNKFKLFDGECGR